MGQKSSKSSDSLPKDFDPAKLLNEIASSCSSSSSSTSTSSNSKSNHDSAISNDSGCYSGLENTEKYNDNGSSVLCLFDSMESTNLPQRKPLKSDELKSNKKTNTNLFKSDFKSKLLKIENYLFLNAEKLETENKHKIRPSSACDSLLYSCSLSSSSNVDMNNDQIMPSITTESEDCNKKAQLLCDQLNKILNISTCLASESIAKAQCQEKNTITNTNLNDCKNDVCKLSNNNKTLNFCKISNFSSSSFKKKNSCNFKSNLVNRSHTFHANNELNINNFNSIDKEIKEEEFENKIEHSSAENSKNTISSYIFKNGRRLFSWNSNSPRLKSLSKRHFLENDYKQKLKPITTLKTEEKIANLIAAKLLSENIDLSKPPYTDEVRIILL